MNERAIYPGNIDLDEIIRTNKKYLHQVNLSQHYEQPVFILFRDHKIQSYKEALDMEIDAFKRLLQNPKFCGKRGEVGIKNIGSNGPVCIVTIGTSFLRTTLSCELKIKGKGKEARIGMFELKPIQGKGPVILVASHYLKNGLHQASDCNKKFQYDLRLTPYENNAASHPCSFFKSKNSRIQDLATYKNQTACTNTIR